MLALRLRGIVRCLRSGWSWTAIVLASLLPQLACAQADLPIYTDHLVNGFQDWSWATRDLENTAPVHSGSNSIRVSSAMYEGLSFYHPPFDTAPYASFSFWANGGGTGGQILQVSAQVNGVDEPPYRLGALSANQWKRFVISLASIHAANQTGVTRFTLQLVGGSTATFYVDDITLVASPAPALVHIDVDANRTIRTADARWFGLNAAVWDNYFDTPQTVSLLKEMGTRMLRFPGGSLSDEYHWASNTTQSNTWRWATSFDRFAQVATNVGAQAFITVNYGSGTAAEAAGWVRDSNITNHYGFRYWEIGNENYGTWETDTNARPNDPYTYAVRAADYLRQMKAADPSIKVGIVATPGEDSSDNGYKDHPAYNSRTGQTHYGWTPVMLTTLKQLGVRPDFLVHHRYPEWSGGTGPDCPDSDPLLLQSASAWAGDAADLRQQISDYFGPEGTNIELVCTENNSDSGAQGKQSTSLVNGLYYADSLGQLMQSEFNAFVWWDLRNGTDHNGSMDPTLYGWRDYGDLGMIGGVSTRHPTFYAAKLMHDFVQPGDTIVGAVTDYLLLSAYGAKGPDGKASLLVINRDSTTNFQAQVSLNGFLPNPLATVYSYGITQDEAARTNGPAEAQDIAETNFTTAATNFIYSFPPFSMTLFRFSPVAPTPPVLGLRALGGQPSKQLVLEVAGQPGTGFILQTSDDLTAWAPVSTNTLAGTSLAITNSLPAQATQQFWRAVLEQ